MVDVHESEESGDFPQVVPSSSGDFRLPSSKSQNSRETLILNGSALSLRTAYRIGGHFAQLELPNREELRDQLGKSRHAVQDVLAGNLRVYGVTTGFGGMAEVTIDPLKAAASQQNLLAFLGSGAGEMIPDRHVRTAMALRANVLLQGKSGVRLALIERLVAFLNADAIPQVREFGSIGASGDLVPLSVIARAITGHPTATTVKLAGRAQAAGEVLGQLGFEPLTLDAKEGLALVNGTSFSAAIAANAAFESQRLLSLALGINGMMLIALRAQADPFHPFVHANKPHPGQVWTAKILHRWLADLAMAETETALPQDRYSLRCFPQYFGSIVESIARVSRMVETEMNAVSDNPLIDPETGDFHQSGNFLGQYIADGMDDLRRSLGMIAKHLDVQIAQLVAPEFNGGLPASLRGEEERGFNMGLKGLQITANSIMPLLLHLGNPLSPFFPTHAEQFNQNINGLSWGAAHLAWRSVTLCRHYLSAALIFAVQALDLRAAQSTGTKSGLELLPMELQPLYTAVRDVLGCTSSLLVRHDDEQSLEDYLQRLNADLEADRKILAMVEPIWEDYHRTFDTEDTHA